MALFKRKDLEAQGLTTDQISWIMTEAQRALGESYTTKASAEEQATEAVRQALEDAPKPVKVEESEEYLALAKELDEVKTISSDAFSVFKPKFRKQVYGMLDHTKPVEEQLAAIRENYEEYCIPEEQPAKNTPQYSRQPGPQKPNPTSAEDELYQKLKDNW